MSPNKTTTTRQKIAKEAIRVLSACPLPKPDEQDFQALPQTLLGYWDIKQQLAEARHAAPTSLQDDSVKLLNDSGLCESIARVFRHHTASRENIGRFSSIYVFPGRIHTQGTPEECFAERKEFVVNNSDADVDAFVSRLSRDIEWFHDLDRSGVRRGERTIATYFLKGERGCGKTFFLNYMMTEKKQQLVDAKICWVRVNLTKPLKNWTLLQRLQHQTLSICRKFYISGRLDAEFNKHLHESFGSTIIDAAASEFGAIPDPSIDEEIANPAQALSESAEEPVPVHLDQLFREVTQFLRGRGLKFLYIIDGLDAALPTSECEEWLDRWLGELPVLWETLSQWPALWLVSVRTESHEKLMRDAGHVISSRDHVHELTLATPSVSHVVRRRFYEASRRAKIANRAPKEVEAYNLCMLFEYFVTAGLSDLHRIRKLTSASVIPDDAVLDYALGLFQGNYRKLMSALELCFARFFFLLPRDRQSVFKNAKSEWDKDFLKDLAIFPVSDDNWADGRAANPYLSADIGPGTLAGELCDAVERRSHEVMSVFMHGRTIHHLLPFDFKIGENGCLHVEKAPYFDYRSSFFPNVFSFSSALTIDWQRDDPVSLDRIRLLPFLQLYILTSLSRGEEFSLREQLYLHIKPAFENRHIVDAALVNLMFYGQVRERTALDGEVYLLLTDAGQYTIQSLLRNSVYLLSVFETIPVPVKMLDAIMNNFDQVMRRSVSRGERHFVRVRIAFLFFRYLKTQWEDIGPEVMNSLDCEFADDMARIFTQIEKSLSDVIVRLAPQDTEIDNGAFRYTAFRRHFLSTQG